MTVLTVRVKTPEGFGDHYRATGTRDGFFFFLSPPHLLKPKLKSQCSIRMSQRGHHTSTGVP